MKVGIGLPNAIPGTPAGLLEEWAVRADGSGFSSLGVVDRPHYGAFEPISSLALAATVTQRIGLITMVVIGPLRRTQLLAEEAAVLSRISGGRFTLGLSIGARPSDFEASGVPTGNRGDRLTQQLIELREWWGLDDPGSGPTLLVGGLSDMTAYRIARYADGYVHGGGPPITFERAIARVRTAWDELGRADDPVFSAQGYYALGDEATVERGRDYMRDYYAFTGPFAERIAEGMLSTPHAIASFVRGYAEAGCHELVLLPAVAEIDQITRLRDVIGDAP